MKRLLSIALTILAVVTVALGRPAMAADIVNGGKIFGANCAACHMGGNNVIMPQKTLKKEALEQFGMHSTEAITNQVKNGKNAMPAFGGRLSDDQIADVAAYVLDQADNTGWQ